MYFIKVTLLNVSFCVLFFTCLNVYAAKKIHHRIVHYGNCDLTKEDYDPENMAGHTWSSYKVHGRIYLRVVFTVQKETPPITFKIRGYRLTTLESKRKEDFAFDTTCRNPILRKMMGKLNINLDMTNCTAKPGTYSIERLDLEEFSRFYQYISKNTSFYQLEVGTTTKKGYTMCADVTMNLYTKS